MNPQATAGRIVHYYAADHDDAPRAAIVNVDTAPDGLAQLTVFARVGPLAYSSVKYSEEPTSGCWSWMPYQKAKAETPEGNVSESAEPRLPQGGHMASMPESAQRAPDITPDTAQDAEDPSAQPDDAGAPS